MSRGGGGAHPGHLVDDDGYRIDFQLGGSSGGVVGGVASGESEGVEASSRKVGGGGSVGDVG